MAIFSRQDLDFHIIHDPFSHDGPKGMLQLTYDGPFTVVLRNDKNFTIHVHDKNTTVSIDQIKPAYLFSDSLTDCLGNNQQSMSTRSNRFNEERN